MPSNYAEIVTGIQTTVAAVDGIRNAYAYEPAALSDRLFYFILAGFEILPPAIADMEIKWTWGARLVVPYVTNERAEPIITALLPSIITAIFTNLSANGAVADGCVEITSGQATYLETKEGKFRIVNFVISCVEHFPFEYAM